jgi:hypothetical protein
MILLMVSLRGVFSIETEIRQKKKDPTEGLFFCARIFADWSTEDSVVVDLIKNGFDW